jgi:hypothetical protein
VVASILQNASGSGSQDATATLASAITAGSQRILFGNCRNGGPRLSQTAPSGMTSLYNEIVGPGQGESRAWSITSLAGDPLAATVHSAGTDYPGAYYLECGGVQAPEAHSGAYAYTASASSGTSQGVTGAPTASSGNVLVVEFYNFDWGEPSVAGTITPGAGWTQLYKYDGAGYGPKYLLQYWIGAYNAVPASGVTTSVSTNWNGSRIIMPEGSPPLSYARMSQEPTEAIVVPSTQAARLSQEPVGVVVVPGTQQARFSQAPVQVVVFAGTPGTREQSVIIA